jgi:D-lactate dehydrogenase
VALDTGVDVHACKMAIKQVVEGLGGKLPAEHGHGTEYAAPAATQARWMAMDPTNTLNPGVGGLSSCRDYKCEGRHDR